MTQSLTQIRAQARDASPFATLALQYFRAQSLHRVPSTLAGRFTRGIFAAYGVALLLVC